MFEKIQRYLPPRLAERLLFLGPGIVLAVEVSGETGLVELLAAGADYGYPLLLVIAVTLAFKYAFANGIARYTVAQGRLIFDGLREIPGPKNWDVSFIMLIYMLETVAFGAIAVVAAELLDILIPGGPSARVIAVALIGGILLLLWKDSYHRFEHILIVMAVFLIGGALYLLFVVPAPVGDAAGALTALNDHSLVTVMALMGVVGSGLNLLLYSVWLREKLGDRHGETCFSVVMRSVNLDLALLFVIVGLSAVAFIGLGAAAAGHGGSDQVLHALNSVLEGVPNGRAVFLITGFFTLFGAVMSGMDGRARAIAAILSSTTTVRWKETTLYRAVLIGFSAVMLLVVFFGSPHEVIHIVAAAASVLFALLGFLLIYIDSRLPAYARGSTLWLVVMAAGSIIFLAVALMEEETILTFGVPMLERVAVVALVIFLALKTDLFGGVERGRPTAQAVAWLVLVFGLLSVYGTMRGIDVSGLVINFRDLGPMIAGLLGGPVAGLLAGVIGGAYRYSLGGWTALPCALAPMVGGLIAGFLGRRWQGEFGYLRMVGLAVLVECLHILVLLPVLTYPVPAGEVVEAIRTTLMPMVVANAVGLVLFAYILREAGLRDRERS